MLLAYPLEFRREYGPHMAQLFRDCYRTELRLQRLCGLPRMWLHVLVDLATTAPKERLQTLGKGVYIVKALRNLIVAIIIYALVLMVTGTFLVKMQAHLPFAAGSFIDAFVAIGILFNFIVLLLMTTRLLVAARAVLASAIVTVALVGGALSFIAKQLPPEARPNGVSILMIALSLAIWFTVHWMWAQRKHSSESAVAK